MNDQKKYHVRRTAGELDWNRAELLTDFVFPWKEEEAPSTEFRALADDVNFYFRFEIEDRDIVLDSSEDPDEAVLGSDRAELFFSPTPDLSEPYYGMEMDPRGGVYDYKGKFHRHIDPSWKMPGLVLKGEVSGDSYVVSGSVPLEVLRDLNCLRGEEMITGVYRAEFSHEPDGTVRQEWISWVNPEVEIPDFHVPSSFGRFLFEKG